MTSESLFRVLGMVTVVVLGAGKNGAVFLITVIVTVVEADKGGTPPSCTLTLICIINNNVM